MLRALLCSVLLFAALPAGGDLNCNDLTIYMSTESLTCTTCIQWAQGDVFKEGNDEGWLCLYLWSNDTFNVCGHTITLWVGTDWNEYCFYTQSQYHEINWFLDSARFDWDDPRGSWARIYIYLPCLNPYTHYQRPAWPDVCYYCQDCTE